MSDRWAAFVPAEGQPWNVRRVVHLHRRAGFAATWKEIQRDLQDGPQTAIDRVLSGEGRTDGVPDEFAAMADVIGDSAVAAANPQRLKAWWLFRILFTPDPLTEKLTLMWHNHFATSNLKVEDVPMMRRQNEIFRKFARAPFGELLPRVVKDPAMLVWLDAAANRKEHPNENLARELMELFSLGVGNYTEVDVKNVARALTGWTTKNNSFRFVPEYHDDGEKTIFGQTGRFDGDDVMKLLLGHPATSRRIAWRICDLFFGEGVLEDSAIEELADGLRQRNLDVGWAVETVLRSRAFFADGNIGNRVLGPVDFVASAIRVLEVSDPPPSTLLLSERIARLGQDLFYPPNVFGWPGGRNWVTTRSIIGRASFAAALVDGELNRPEIPLDIDALVSRHIGSGDDQAISQFFNTLFATSDPSEIERIIRGTTESSQRMAKITKAILASPEAQLG